MSTLADQEILSALDAWAAAHVGPDATIVACVRMPGHSSLTYGVNAASGGEVERLVLRLPPSGSARQSAALLRQVRLLRVVGAHGVPVLDVRWSDEDPRGSECRTRW